MGGIAFYSSLAGREDNTSIPVLEFRAKEFSVAKEEGGKLAFASVHAVERDEVDRYCPRLSEVQDRTDRITAQVDSENLKLSPQNRGTEIHTRLRDEIREMSDPNFKAEQSLLKSETTDRYGEKGSIRIDVYERVGDGTVCIYDIKTGRAEFTGQRMAEIASRVYRSYPDTTRILLSEIRPR